MRPRLRSRLLGRRFYGGTAASSNQSKIESKVLQDTAGGQEASFVINLKDQADLSAAYEMKNQDARGWYVYRTLKKEAARTQAPIRPCLPRTASTTSPSGSRT